MVHTLFLSDLQNFILTKYIPLWYNKIIFMKSKMATVTNPSLTDAPSTVMRAISRLETSFIAMYLDGPSCTSLMGTAISRLINKMIDYAKVYLSCGEGSGL